ncbi:MAG: murein biosynthesis integral membrane protein MurJ [Clostridia bacterium]
MAEAKTFKTTAFMIMVSVLLSRILGFIRTALIPIKLGGLSDVADAYTAAFQISDLMYGLLVGGAIAASLIPVLTGFIEKKEEKEGWRVVSSFINIMILIMLGLAVLSVVFAPQLMNVIARGFLGAPPEKMLLTVKLTRILVPIAFFMMLSGFCNGILNSYSKFAVAAFGPVVYNLASVLSIFFLSNPDPNDDYGVVKVAMGIVGCALLYFIFQFVFTFRHLKHYVPVIQTRHPEFSKMVRLAVPSLLTSTLMQVNVIVSKAYTTFFDTGSVAALELANKTWQMPLGIIAQSIGVAMLPAMSALYARNKHTDILEKLKSAIRFVLFLGLPSAGAMAVLSRPMVQLLFNFGGKLGPEGVELTASILSFYSIALVAQCVSTIMNRAYYSTKNSFIPFVNGAITVVLNLGLAYVITAYTGMGVKGIAFAFSISSIVNTILLVNLFKMRIRDFKFFSIGDYYLKIILSTLVMMGVILLMDAMLLPVVFRAGIMDISKIAQAAWVGAEVVVGMAVYFTASHLLKVREAGDIVGGAFRKLKKIAKI